MYKKYREWVMANVSRRTILESLAEESSELTKAALKTIRAEGLAPDSPTPVSVKEAHANIIEEFNDVCLCMIAVLNDDNRSKQDFNPRWRRWAERNGYTGE